MDNELVKRGLEISIRKRKWLILAGLIGISGYGAYRVYHMPSVVRKRERILKLFQSIASMAELASGSAETMTIVTRDLKVFLNSDSDEIPMSLKQLSKIARSEEFSGSVARVCQSMMVGILSGYKVENSTNGIQESGNSSFPDRLMDKMMSSAGTGFVSVVVGSFARNLVLGFYGNSDELSGNNSDEKLPTWVSVVTDDRCRVLVADCINSFVSTAVTVYLDKTMDVNLYDDVFSALTNPKHQNKVADILASLCNGAVETLVKTSHQVLTASEQSPVKRSSDSYSIVDPSEASKLGNKNGYVDVENTGWVSSVSSTLAVPSNRKFMLDLTGRVTFETVRSVIEFSLWKITEGLKRSMNVVHDEVVGRGFEVVRYVGAKSYIILTICLALFLHILGSTRVMLPA
ncbi:hypothetical protein ACS0TY_025919 [Phlomoides rotata]